MKKTELAVENFQKGLNCAQSVVCAFAEEMQMSEEDIYKVSEGFGGGIGGLRKTCGAVSGMAMVISVLNCGGTKLSRMDTYQKIQEAVHKFEAQNGSSECADLKGLTGKGVLRSCPDCVKDCASILCEMYQLD